MRVLMNDKQKTKNKKNKRSKISFQNKYEDILQSQWVCKTAISYTRPFLKIPFRWYLKPRGTSCSTLGHPHNVTRNPSDQT